MKENTICQERKENKFTTTVACVYELVARLSQHFAVTLTHLEQQEIDESCHPWSHICVCQVIAMVLTKE